MDTFQNLGTPNRSRFGVFKLSKPKRLKSRHGLPDSVSDGLFVYRALSELDADGAWGTWLGEQRDAAGACQPVLLKHTGEKNRTRAGADALWLEALLTLKLDGPHVVQLVDYGVLDGRPFAVYAFEEGVFLAQVIEGLRERGRRLPSSVAVGIVLQACDLVRRLHKLSLGEEETQGFVHGSLCPRNFMLTERGDVKVMGLIGARPVGRIVGREHVPAAAMAYASPDLLGGAPVTPAVDVHSLAAVLQELLGETAPEGEKDELGGIVRELLRHGPGAGFTTVDTFAAALQDAVRRTGTVVARQAIGAQVRGVCEQYLLERRRQVRALRETEWGDVKEAPKPQSNGAAKAEPVAALAPSPDELENIEAVAAEEESAGLNAYQEDSGDDAVTRIYDGEDLERGSPAPGQAWMHDSRPAEAARSGWSRWAVVGLLGVLVLVASGAALMASRAGARASQVVAVAAEGKGSKASESANAEAGRGGPTVSASSGAASPPLAAVHGQGSVEAATDSPALAADDSDEERAATNSGRKLTARQRAAMRRAAMAKRAARAKASGTQPTRAVTEEPEESTPAAEAEAAAEPATVDVLDLPEAQDPEPQPAAAGAKSTAAGGDSDLVIEEGAPKVSYLSVDATPYATVFIDGENKGVTPLVGLQLSPGLHRMIARTEDGRTKRYTLQLDPGKTEAVKVTWEE